MAQAIEARLDGFCDAADQQVWISHLRKTHPVNISRREERRRTTLENGGCVPLAFEGRADLLVVRHRLEAGDEDAVNAELEEALSAPQRLIHANGPKRSRT